MSRNAGGGYFKDLGNLSQNFFNQIASDIRSNAEQIVSSAFQNESCERRGVPPDSDRTTQVRMSILHENTKIFMPCPSILPKQFWSVQNGFSLTKLIWN